MRTLDDDLRRANFELWRTKQVSDFLAGIWAQGYGQVYESAINYLLLSQQIARIVFALVVLLLILAGVRHRARTKRDARRAVDQSETSPLSTA